MLDWTAAWRTWVRNERKFQKQPFQQSAESASYTPPDRIQKLLQQAQEREKYLIATGKYATVVNEETGEITQASDLPKVISKGLTIRL